MKRAPQWAPFRHSYLGLSRERAFDLFAFEDLDHVLRANVVVDFEGHAAFLTGLDLFDLVLETLERLQRAFVDHDVVAQQAYTGGPAGYAFGHQTPSHVSDARHLEHFLDLGIADEVFADLGPQKARCSGFHIVNQVVDDRVIADLDTFLVRGLASGRIGAHVEADDRGARRFGKADIGFGDRADAVMQHANADLVVADLFQRLDDGLGRPLNVGFHHDLKLGHVLVGLGVRQKLIERGGSTGSGTFVLGGLLAVFRDLARLRLGIDHVQHVAGLGCAVQAQNLDRNRRARFAHAFTLVVHQRADLAPLFADDKDIALPQGALVDQNRRDRATAHVKLRLDDGTLCGTVGVGFQFEQFGLKRDGFQQFGQALACVCRNLDVLNVTRHFLNHHFVL